MMRAQLWSEKMDLESSKSAVATLFSVARGGSGASPGAARILLACHTISGPILWEDLLRLADRNAALELISVMATCPPFRGLEELGLSFEDIQKLQKIAA